MTRREEVEQILRQHPALHDGGYGQPRHRRRCAPVAIERNHLLTPASVLTIDNVVCWLALRIAPIQTINRRHSSYGLKHIYERERGEYCSNGQFIVAALIRGYSADFSHYNVCFAMSERSIKTAWDIAHATPWPVAWRVKA